MINGLSALVLAILLSGCGITAGRYTPQVELIQALRNGSYQAIRIGTFEAKNPSINRVSLRANSLESPTETFERYLGDALRQEFEGARLLNAQSDLELAGVLLRNDVSAAIGTGKADLEAAFTLKRGAMVVYARTHSAHHEWDSSFVAATAIPAAAQNYPTAVQKLVKELVGDPGFLEALRK